MTRSKKLFTLLIALLLLAMPALALANESGGTTPIAITVTAVDITKEYDGEALTPPTNPVEGTDYTVAGDELLAEHTLVVTLSGTQTNAGHSPLTVAAKVVDDSGNEVADGTYAITAVNGQLKVEPKTITITPASAQKEYDGTPLTVEKDAFTSEGELEGHIVSAEIKGSQTDVGEKDSTILDGSITVVNKENESVKSNYSFVKNTGKLVVTKAEVTLTSESAEKVYDGTALTKPTVTVSGTGKTVFESEIDPATLKATGSATHVADGSVTNAIVYTTNAAFNADNYKIVKDEGTLKIKPVEITVKTLGATKVYDGKELINREKAPEITKGAFVGTENIECTYTGTQTNAGTSKNTISYTFINGAAASNYNITVDAGDLTVTPRKLVFKSPDAKKTYDGKALTTKASDMKIGGDGMVGNEKVIFTMTGSQTKVGKSRNTYRYEFAAGVDKNNYTVYTETGELKVSASGSSTQTGVDDHWPTLLGGSALLLAASAAIVIALRKRTRRNDG